MERWIFAVIFAISAFVAVANETTATIKKAEAGILRALNKAFLLTNKSDGSSVEDVNVSIGKSIRRNPRSFLKALKENWPKVRNLGATVGNLGPDYDFNFKGQKVEL